MPKRRHRPIPGRAELIGLPESEIRGVKENYETL
jgi:hypothetical protein